MITNVIVAVIALIVGGGLGYGFRGAERRKLQLLETKLTMLKDIAALQAGQASNAVRAGVDAIHTKLDQLL